MKIVLIDTFEYLKAINKYPAVPAGLLNLATILTEHGHETEIINFNYLFLNRVLRYDDDPEQKLTYMAQYIIDKKPAIVGFTTVCSLFHNALLLSRVLKNMDGGIKIIFGGPHVSVFPEKILERYPWIDAVCVGEAEHTIIDIVTGLKEGDPGDAAGLVYRRGGRIISNAPAELIEDLDTLPLVDYDLIPAFQDVKEIPLETGRGCPYRCIYCSTAGFWQRKFRVKSIERICGEIRHVRRVLKEKEVFYNFVHDNFTTNYDFTSQLCHELQKFNIRWGCGARVDTLDENLVALMAQSGCQSMLIGLETASPAMQKYIRKELDIDKFISLVDVILAHKISLVVSFIYGFPPETEADLRATLGLMYRLIRKGVGCHLHALGVLAGTPLYEPFQDKLVLGDYYSDLADTANLALSLPYIREDKEIFAQFYTLSGTLLDQYPLLDQFVNLIFVKLFNFFPETFVAILEVFAGEILDFYGDFIFHVPDFTNFISSGVYNKIPTEHGFVAEKSPLSKQLIGYFSAYICRKAAGDFQFKIILQRFCREKEAAAARLSAAVSGKSG